MPTDTAPSHPVAAPPAMRADAARFGPFLLLPGEQRLLRDGTDVALSPRAMEVLQVLAERPGQLVTKDELLTRAWHGLVVEESNLHVQVSQIRKAIGTQWIATVPGLGYRLVPCEPRTDPEGAGPSRRALSVLVLPFVESAAPPEQAYFADAITDDVVAQLSRIRGCTVIASGTSFALRGEGADWAQAAREMGVRYALHGRIERDETGVEVIARLSDVATRAVIWSDRIEVDAAGVRQIRRELVSRLAAALDLELLFAEASRTGSRSPAEIRAHDLVMRARASSRSNWVRPDYLRALSLFEQALRLDPEEPDALAGRALALVSEAIGWPGPELPEQLARAEADALRALALDSTSREAHLSLSMVRQQQFRFDDALASAQTALELDPNFPWRCAGAASSTSSSPSTGPLGSGCAGRCACRPATRTGGATWPGSVAWSCSTATRLPPSRRSSSRTRCTRTGSRGCSWCRRASSPGAPTGCPRCCACATRSTGPTP
jgi:TolB-like protein/DNA-binding winged helix-turn-helix (wHTH) protein